MKWFKRAVACALAAALSFSSFLQSAPVLAAQAADVADTGDLNEADFSSMRLVVLADDTSVIAHDSDIIGQYENVYLLQFPSVQQTMNAYAYYKDKVPAVEPDTVVETASLERDPEELVKERYERFRAF